MPARKRKKITRTPHDAVFKQFLTDPAVAKDFMAQHLSESVRAVCDFSTLRLASGSFVEESLRACFSDVLYSLKTAGGDGYIYVLIEHQSTPDRHMAFRLLRYAVAVMQRHLDAGHTKLPLVIPVLFYNGKRSPYPFRPTGFMDLPIPIWRAGSMAPISPLSTSRRSPMTRLCITGRWRR